MNFNIEISGVVIELHHRYDYIKKICHDYISDKSPVLSVSVSEEQIEAEVTLTNGRFSKEICESTCLHREITRSLVKYGIILVHSAVVAVDGEAYVFMAKSGVGKSTHVRLWEKMFGHRSIIVNGDKPMFSFINDVLIVHGSPWKGKENWGENISLPVKAFCFLERGSVNEIIPAKQSDIINRLFHQVLLPKDAIDMITFMNLINCILKKVPFYILRCNMEKEAALVAYEGMTKNDE